MLYAPIVPFWIYFIFRSRAVWFFTPSNPKLTFGGMEGEPKKEMYDLLPPSSFPTTFNVLPTESFYLLTQRIEAAGIPYPLIVKPEIGGQGILFRKIDTPAELEHYHSLVPVEYIVQEMVHFPVEVSVFYIRHPLEQRGKITGLLQKVPLHVLGDGIHTLKELVSQHSKAARRYGELHSKHKETWNEIVAEGQKYILSYAANHNRGAHFIDLKSQIDDALVAIFDKISIEINDFFYGRYDIMCQGIDELKHGEKFTILEYNGCGAEPNHFYDTGYSLTGAYREILKHWKALYSISSYNKSIGIQPWPYKKGKRFMKKTNELYRIMREADANID